MYLPINITISSIWADIVRGLEKLSFTLIEFLLNGGVRGLTEVTVVDATAACFRIVNCDGVTADVFSSQTELLGYVGQVIEWTDDLNNTFYGTVQQFDCYTLDFSPTNVTVEECYDTCQEAVPVPEEPEVFQVTRRTVEPGFILEAFRNRVLL
jgi:hypothetical protein